MEDTHMSSTPSDKTVPNRQQSGRNFVTLTDIAELTNSDLRRCGDPDPEVDGMERVFAVAAQHGLVQDHSQDHEYEAFAVLYMTPDAEQVVELWIPAAVDEIGRVPRSTVADPAKLSASDQVARKYASALVRHPEVDR